MGFAGEWRERGGDDGEDFGGEGVGQGEFFFFFLGDFFAFFGFCFWMGSGRKGGGLRYLPSCVCAHAPFILTKWMEWGKGVRERGD